MEINSISDLSDEHIIPSFGIEPTIEVEVDELRERMIDFGKQKKSLEEREDSLKKLVGRIVHLKPDSATKGQCGNKHINLVKMGRVVNELYLSDFEIPMPQSLSTEEIKAFWQKRNPVILTHWRDLQKEHAEYKESIPFLGHPKAIDLLKKIHEAVQDSFTNNEDVPIPDDWLEEKKDCFLMVRSSGAEDSEKTANAGGNVSIAYVPASDRKAVCSAIGNVVQSYFSKTSLQNRLNAGLNPFEEDLSLGVVLQELIGEPVGGSLKSEDIPVSFVLFTNEPLFIGGEPFRVMQLSATYGHGEAVVGDVGIATDTAYILHSVANPEELFILYTNQLKQERLVPQSENPITLSSFPNPPDLINQRALSDEQLLSIYRDAILVEGIFDGKATDIEGIVRKGTVHFVQARPVNRQPMLPTHLRSIDAILETVDAETVVPANGSVVIIRNRREILCAHTLQEAEERYRSANPPKLVIVTERPSATSHPVVNFRGLNIPCLCIEDVQKREKILEQVTQEHLLAVCMQTASLNLWDSSIALVEDEITPGFAVHPATLAISLPIPDLSVPTPSVEKVAPMKKMIRESDWSKINEEIIQLGKRIVVLESEMTATTGSPIKLRIEALRQLEKHLIHAMREVMAAEAVPDLRLRALFYRKVLETLLVGSATQNRAVGQYNLMDAEAIIDDIEKLIGYEKKLTHPSYLLDLLPYGSFVFEEWQIFLLGIENLIRQGRILNEEISQFKTLIHQIHRTGAFPFWFTFFQSGATFHQILNQIDSKDIALLDDLLRLHHKIQGMSGRLSRFSDPQTFDSAWVDLKALIEPLSSAAWLNLINDSSSPIVKTIAYRTMAEGVDLLDRASKELKSSQNFPDPLKKVALFKQMLFPYYDLMNGWIRSLLPRNVGSLLPTDMSVAEYLIYVKTLLESRPATDTTQLLPSSNFSVSAAILGAKTAFYRHTPETLEDILTLLHQNALVALNISNQNLLTADRLRHSLLPREVQETMQFIEGGRWGRSVQRIGLQVNIDKIVIEYNVPLRNHSGHLELFYDRVTKEISIKGQFLGQARFRWRETSDWIRALDRARMIMQKTPLRQTEQELTFIWKVRENELQAVLDEYNGMAEWSLEDDDRIIHRIWHRWSSHPNRYLLLEEFLKASDTIKVPMLWAVHRNGGLHPELIRLYMDDSLIWNDHDNNEIQAEILRFIKIQVRQKFYADELIALAQKGMQKTNIQVRSESLLLFRELVLQGKGINEARRALSEALTSSSTISIIFDEEVAALSHALFPNQLDSFTNGLNYWMRESTNYMRRMAPIIPSIAVGAYIAYNVYQTAPSGGMKSLIGKASVFVEGQRKAMQVIEDRVIRSFAKFVSRFVQLQGATVVV